VASSQGSGHPTGRHQLGLGETIQRHGEEMDDIMRALPIETDEATMKAAIPNRAVWEDGKLCAVLTYKDKGIEIIRHDGQQLHEF
jgi:hypothetical protein